MQVNWSCWNISSSYFKLLFYRGAKEWKFTDFNDVFHQNFRVRVGITDGMMVTTAVYCCIVRAISNFISCRCKYKFDSNTISATGAYGEIIPSRAEQSTTKDSDEASYGAHLALDGDINTRTSTKSGGGQWFQVNLDGLPCVKEVEWYYRSDTPKTTWTCVGDSCTCSGSYCSWTSMDITTVGEYETHFNSDCKYGNNVKFTFSSTWQVSFSEIKITGIAGKIEILKSGNTKNLQI